ncbi:hypothetical protein N494_10455 [Clostridium botulinum A2B7 92]|uniref:DUF2975 domain-containing protein n=1 Tax=Clostridium botulinum TaxID=1491 RepID=UPI0007DE7DD2|nr:DUF2975 domain-containing protein [Clostridium botulinum]KEJ01363.1 hypothetical protein N494_10455 [Clostridium botulinum A2B7 92]
MKEKTSSKVLNGLVIVGIILTILALISTPLVLTAFLKTSGMKLETSNMEWILTACIYACAVPYLIALFRFKRICKLLTSKNSFSPIISKEFQALAICAFVEACIYLLSNLFLYLLFDFYLFAMTIVPLIVVIFVAITVGFLFLIMSSIFKTAAEIKEENDLTF